MHPRRFSIAPMMDWTDRHCRSFHRILSTRALLYTEMVTTGAVLYGPRDRLLGYEPRQHPVAAQLGGSDPGDLASAARIVADYGYDEINLNVGCPSDRVQNGAFGACLMREPALVGACVAAMRDAVALPVTVKCRLGVDDQEPREALWAMARSVAEAGAAGLVVHARKAWLQGLSPKENRDVPPLDYSLVHALKQDFPALPIVLNGGLGSLEAALPHLDALDGVMLGRAAYHEPGLLLNVDARVFGAPRAVADEWAALDAYAVHIEAQLSAGARLHDMTRHMLGLFTGRPGARAYRRHLATHAVRKGAGLEVLRAAVALVSRETAAAA